MTGQKPHPVELINYFFTEQTVRANPDHQANNDCIMESRMTTHVAPLPNGSHACELTIELDDDKSTNPSYFYRVVAYGIFSVSENLEEEKIDEFIQKTSIQILTGVIRERLAEITSRGPWRQVLLRIASIPHGLLQPDK